jgi:DHA1 family multidrug resistance protein-like MFS transporter
VLVLVLMLTISSPQYGLLKLPYALTAWVAAAFCAPAVGPLLSGFSVVVKGWRWALWEVLWGAAPVFVLMFISMPETSAANILLRRAQRLRKLTGNANLKSQGEIDQGSLSFSKIAAEQLWKPIEIFLKDPAVFFTNVYTSLIYGEQQPILSQPPILSYPILFN